MHHPITKEFLKIITWSVTFIIIFTLSLWIWGKWHDDWSGYNDSLNVSDGHCNIAVVPISGNITTTGVADENKTLESNVDDVVGVLQQAESDPYILGAMVRIDSYGGSAVASEIIANTLKKYSLPTVALVREGGTSGGYLAATGADTIIASPFSDIGAIGVTMSYVENWRQNSNDGLNYVSLSSAPYKDYGSPDKPLTTAERVLLERDLDIWHQEFIKQVAENRELTVNHVSKLADGSSLPGKMALENKLIDALGDQESARQWFAKELELPLKAITFCE